MITCRGLAVALLATCNSAMAWPPADLAPASDTTPAAPFGQHRGYADSPLGQVHYVDVDPGRRGGRAAGPTVVLLHQTPWFHVFYVQIQLVLAKRGFRSGRVIPSTTDTMPLSLLRWRRRCGGSSRGVRPS